MKRERFSAKKKEKKNEKENDIRFSYPCNVILTHEAEAEAREQLEITDIRFLKSIVFHLSTEK